MISYRTSATATAPRSLAWRENLDGTMEVEAYCPSGATQMTVQPVYPGLFGYVSQLGTLATATGCSFLVGVPKETVASGTWGSFIVAGYVPSLTWAASITGTANLPLVWQSSSGLAIVAASCSSSMFLRVNATGTMPCGVHRYQAGYDPTIATYTLTSSQLATTEHAIYLWGVYVTNNGG